MEKTQYRESCRLDTYRVDRNEIGKPSGLWQLMQEAASNQMEAQKPSYTDLVDAGQALMLARVDLAIPEQIGLKEALVSSSWPCAGDLLAQLLADARVGDGCVCGDAVDPGGSREP